MAERSGGGDIGADWEHCLFFIGSVDLPQVPGQPTLTLSNIKDKTAFVKGSEISVGSIRYSTIILISYYTILR